jgi:hypothetical protein
LRQRVCSSSRAEMSTILDTSISVIWQKNCTAAVTYSFVWSGLVWSDLIWSCLVLLSCVCILRVKGIIATNIGKLLAQEMLSAFSGSMDGRKSQPSRQDSCCVFGNTSSNLNSQTGRREPVFHDSPQFLLYYYLKLDLGQFIYTRFNLLFTYSDTDKRFFCSSKRPISLLFSGYRSAFPGVKLSELEINNSSQSSIELKNEGRYTASPRIYICGKNAETFPFRKIRRCSLK